jgi:hypothetical protein
MMLRTSHFVISFSLRRPWVYWETGGETHSMDDGHTDGCPVFCISYSRRFSAEREAARQRVWQ